MDFGLKDINPNKTPIEIIEEGAIGGTYFRDIYSIVNGKWYRNSWKEFNSLKNIDPKYYSSNFYDVKINKYGVKCGSYEGWINSIDPYGWFQWYCRYYLGRRCSDDGSRFKGILVKTIKNKGAKFDDYSISPKIRQILLHWGYELVESDLL